MTISGKIAALCVGLLIAFGTKNLCSQPSELLNDLKEHIKEGDSYKVAITHYKIAQEYYAEYEDSLADKHFKESIDLLDSLNIKRELAIVYNAYGNLISLKGDLNRSYATYKEAYRIAESINNDTIMSFALNNMGLEQKTLGNYDKSLEHLFASLKIKEKIGASDKSFSTAFLNIGLVLDLNEDLEEAFKYYDKSLELKLQIQDSLGASRVYGNQAVIRKNQEKYDEALRLLNLSEALNNGDLNQDYVIATNKGNLFLRLNDTAQAISYLNKAKEIALAMNDAELMSDANQNIAHYYIRQNQHEKAIRFTELALEHTAATKSLAQWRELNAQLSEIYVKAEDFEKAFHYMKLSELYEDSIFNMEKQGVIAELQTRYETEKKEKQIAQKNEELAVSELALKNRQSIIMYLVIAILVLVLAGYIVFKRIQAKQKEKQLAAQRMLEAYSKEIDVLRAQINAQMGDEAEQISASIDPAEINKHLINPLSERELEVLNELASGKTNNQIAETIFVSANTVKYHLKNIYVKLDAQNRTEALLKANSLNILQ